MATASPVAAADDAEQPGWADGISSGAEVHGGRGDDNVHSLAVADQTVGDQVVVVEAVDDQPPTDRTEVWGDPHMEPATDELRGGPDPLVWLSLGDSYSSGTTDASSGDCLTSSQSFSHQAVARLRPRIVRPIHHYHGACYGATLSPARSETDLRKNAFQQVANLVPQVKPDVVTVTIGGNDAGFAAVLRGCMTALCPSLENMPTKAVASPYGGEMSWEKLQQELVGFYRYASLSIHQANPEGRLYVVSYPELFDRKGSLDRSGNDSCVYGIRKEEVLRLNAASTKIGDVIQAAIAETNHANRLWGIPRVEFIDWRSPDRLSMNIPEPVRKSWGRWVYETHRHPIGFNRNGICADTVGRELHMLWPTGSRSYLKWFHPNAKGLAAIGHQVADEVEDDLRTTIRG